MWKSIYLVHNIYKYDNYYVIIFSEQLILNNNLISLVKIYFILFYLKLNFSKLILDSNHFLMLCNTTCYVILNRLSSINRSSDAILN